MNKDDRVLNKVSILKDIHLNSDENEEIWKGVKTKMSRIEKPKNKKRHMNLFLGFASTIGVLIAFVTIGLMAHFGHSSSLSTNHMMRSSSKAPPPVVIHNNVNLPVYYVLTGEKVNNVGKLITTLKTRKWTSKDHWTTPIVGDKIEVRELPGVDPTKAVAIKISPNPYSPQPNYYVKAVAESKKLYEGK